LDDEWGIADAENDEGIALASRDRVNEAATVFERSRERFTNIHAPELAAMVGDNLAQMYLKLGRVREALHLSQTSLVQELADGRISDSLGSRTDIARALAALGRRRQAYESMRAAVASARTAGLNGQLADMLEVESTLAESLGEWKQALADEREAVRLVNATNTPALHALETELEQRYAVREKELRISDLERDNRLKDLELKEAHAEAARHAEAQQRQKLANVVVTLVAAGLVVVAGLLFLLLRSQRRHAAELRAQALRDPLTGIDNRRAFQQRAMALIAGSHDTQQPPHVLMLIDFDHFKHINDSVGHPQGDRVLAVVSAYLQSAVDGVGDIARIGGEEFAVLCPRFGAEAGMRLAETLRAGVAAMVLPADVQVAQVTVSIGVALFDGTRCHDLSSWMRAADAALYSAKSFGRDRVVASVLVG